MNIFGPLIERSRLRRSPPLSRQGLSNELSEIGIFLSADTIAQIERRKRKLKDTELMAMASVLKISLKDLDRYVCETDAPQDDNTAAT